MITVFTPTYNRVSTLKRLYKSLQKQTCMDFEWLIIDDGSTDATESEIRQWMKEGNPFTIRYIKTSNGGKHRAINLGVQKARSEAFFIVDSDDTLPPRSIDIIAKNFSAIVTNAKFAGICGLKADMTTKQPLYNSRKAAGKDCSMLNIRYKYHIKGDMAEVFKTSVLKSLPFPSFEGENFLNEAVVWNRIAKKYIMHYISDILYYCQYLPDGLTASIRQRYRTCPLGTKLFYGELIKDKNIPTLEKLKTFLLYWRYLCFNKKAKNILSGVPFVSFLFILPGATLFILDKMKEKK